MITVDGKWTMEGLDQDNRDRIKSYRGLTELINLRIA